MTRYVSIGLFVTLISAGTIIYVMQTSSRIGTTDTYTVYAYVDDASGLIVDSIVRLAGVDVGRLEAIELDGNRARLTLRIRESVHLYEDAVVAKATESILGSATVVLSPGGQGAMLQPGDEVRQIRQMANISDAVESANQLAMGAALLVEEFQAFLRDGETVDALNEIVAVARQTALATSELLEQNLLIARSTLQNIEAFSLRLDDNAERQLMLVQEILESTAQLTARLDRLVGENEASVTRSIREIETSLTDLQGVIASLQGSVDNVQEITQVVRDGEGNVGKLIRDDELYTRAVRITEKAEDFLDSTVGLGVQVDFRSELLMDQLATKDRFDLRLTPARGDRFYSVGVINTPVPSTTRTTTEERITEDGTTTDTVTRTTERTDDLKLNLQLARIWGPLTVRAGVLESTAGVGVDVTPFRQLVLSGEVFDFGADDGVYIRGFGSLYPFYDPTSANPLRWLYLTGGVDDAMDVYRRNFFLGAGVRFTDQDLRGLVGFIPLN